MKLSELKNLIKQDFKSLREANEAQEQDNKDIEDALADLEDDGLYDDSESLMKETRAIIASWRQNKLTEKKSKPDYLDVDNDNNTKEPMKKALKDKKKKAVKEYDQNWDGRLDYLQDYGDEKESDIYDEIAMQFYKCSYDECNPHQQDIVQQEVEYRDMHL